MLRADSAYTVVAYGRFAGYGCGLTPSSKHHGTSIAALFPFAATSPRPVSPLSPLRRPIPHRVGRLFPCTIHFCVSYGRVFRYLHSIPPPHRSRPCADSTRFHLLSGHRVCCVVISMGRLCGEQSQQVEAEEECLINRVSSRLISDVVWPNPRMVRKR